MAYNNLNDNYAGIIQAFGQVRSDAGETQKYYPPNYQGIIDAILDMSKAWSGATPNEYPPGWNPVYDEDGNVIGGNWAPGYEPAQGNLWFDERQGRLMVYVDDAYYQANGADVLTRVQTEQPEPDVPGALWYNPDTADLYIFDGTVWLLISSQSINTMTLPLANPTDEASVNARVLPDSSGLTSQADFNQWLVTALQELDSNLGGNAEIYVSSASPSNPQEADLWYSTDTLELFVRYNNFWVPSSLPLVSDPNFISLSSAVSALDSELTARIDAANSRLSTLEQEPHKSYTLGIDNAQLGIKLTDEEGLVNNVSMQGAGGILVANVGGVLTYDGSSLQSSITNIESTYTTPAQRTALEQADQLQQQRITDLENTPTVSVNDYNALATTVASLPTTQDLNTKLPLSGGNMVGQIDMQGNRLRGLTAAIQPDDAVRNNEFEQYKSIVASTYAPLSNPVFNGLVVERDDAAVPGIKFSDGAVGGCCAIELNTNRNTGAVAYFGQTMLPGEVAWEFDDGTDNFSWTHDVEGKKLRIDKDEVVINQLSLGTFSKDGNGVDVITNKIDVNERITTYQTALQGVRTALSNSTSFEDFKTAAFNALVGI